MKVELKYAGVPRVGFFAAHYWFVTDNGQRDRWEVWQDADVGRYSVGHLHWNLMRPDSSVGGGPTHHAHSWTDEPAERIAEALHESWELYPYRHHYRMVPGPNSNTFVTWILRRAAIKYRLSWRAIGKDFV